MDGSDDLTGVVNFDLPDGVNSVGWASGFAYYAAVGLPVGVDLWSIFPDPGSALLLHVTHLIAVTASDGLFLGSGAVCGLGAEPSPAKGGLSSLKADGVDHTELLVIQGIQVTSSESSSSKEGTLVTALTMLTGFLWHFSSSICSISGANRKTSSGSVFSLSITRCGALRGVQR